MRQIHRSEVESHTAQRLDIDELNGGALLPDASLWDGLEYLHTGQPVPVQFCKQEQWNTCWHGIVIKPFVSSIRSKHTGHVGSSIRLGVGGGKGLRVYDAIGARD